MTRGAASQRFGYDGFGNLTDLIVTAGSAATMSVTYNPLTNRRNGETADANGNIGAGTQYQYDIENRIRR